MSKKIECPSLKPWELLASRIEKQYKHLKLRLDQARSPRTGAVHDFFVLEVGSWVNIIPITPDNKILLIRQYRHGIRSMTLEIPGGIVEADDSPEEAAVRELREETGYKAGEIVSLGWVHPIPAIHNNRCFTFLAKNVVPDGLQKQDECEDIEVVLYPVSAIKELIASGKISHALVIAAFQRYFLRQQ